MKNKITLLGIVVMLGLFINSTAYAGTFYRIGYNAAQNLADSAWNNLDRNCRNFKEFNAILKEGIRDAARDMRTRYKGSSAKDFALGYQAGLRDVLNNIRNQCGHRSWIRRLLDALDLFIKNLFSDFLNQALDNTSSYADREVSYEQPYTAKTNTYESSSYYTAPPIQNNRNGKLYRNAYQTANRLAKEAWNNIGQDCMKTSLLMQILGKDMSAGTIDINVRHSGRSAKELTQGYIAGVMDVMDNVLNRCISQCR